METEQDGRMLALRQAVAIALALSTRGSAHATELALELLHDLKEGIGGAPPDSPFDTPPWQAGAQDELQALARLVSAYSQSPSENG